MKVVDRAHIFPINSDFIGSKFKFSEGFVLVVTHCYKFFIEMRVDKNTSSQSINVKPLI